MRVHYLLIAAACSLAPVAAYGADGPLRVGAGRVEFTRILPAGAMPASGRYEHERLFVRVIVLDNGTTRAALINVDGAGTASGRAKAAEELKIPLEHVIISGTHTHSASLTDVSPGTPTAAQRQAPAASSPLDPFVVQAVREAVSRLQPAVVGFGTGRSYLNVNRDAINPKTRTWTQEANLEGPSDKTVAVLKFETPVGEPIAYYMNYAMHPVNLYLGGIVSADFPGAAARYIEQIYEDRMVAVFSQGAEGDQNPLYLRASTAAMLQRGGQKYMGQPLVREEVEAEIREGRRPMVPLDAKAADAISKFVEAEGIIFAEEVLRIAHGTKAVPLTGRLVGVQRTITCPGRVRTSQGREGVAATYTDGPDANLLVGMLGIGTIGLTWVNAEVYNPVAQQVKAASPLANTVFVGLANGQSGTGYVPTDDAFGRQTFQVLGSRLKPGCAEAGIRDALVDMLTAHATAPVQK